MAERLGMKVLHTRTIAKLARPTDLAWEWPKSFLNIYLPKIAERGYLAPGEPAAALAEFDALTAMPNAMILCPTVLEVVLEKV
jgi:hypothetical protein